MKKENSRQFVGIVCRISKFDTLPGQEAEVKGDIVSYNRVVLEESDKAAGELWESRGGGDISLRYAAEQLDTVGQRALWIDQGMKGINDFLTLKLYGADLNDFIGIRVQAGGFQVQGDICLVHGGIIPL